MDLKKNISVLHFVKCTCIKDKRFIIQDINWTVDKLEFARICYLFVSFVMSCIFSSLVEKSLYFKKKKNPDTLFILLSISWMFLLSLLWLLSICTSPRFMINIPIDVDQSKSNLACVCNNDYKKFQQSSAMIKNINGKHIIHYIKKTPIFFIQVFHLTFKYSQITYVQHMKFWIIMICGSFSHSQMLMANSLEQWGLLPVLKSLVH